MGHKTHKQDPRWCEVVVVAVVVVGGKAKAKQNWGNTFPEIGEIKGCCTGVD